MKWMLSIFFLNCFVVVQAQLLDSLVLDTIYSFTSIEEALKQPEKVIKLELRKKKLKNFPTEIYQFNNLQYLDLSKNNLSEIPDSIEVLTQLQYLDVSKNKLQVFSAKIGKLENLFHLNLNNNEFSAIPVTIGNLKKLRSFDLWSNNLDVFPESLSKLKNLRVMDLRAILISDKEQSRIKSLLPRATIHFSPSCNCKW
jgi:Leucine-rich repeat (LRR) protein